MVDAKADCYEDLVKCGILEMKLPRKQRRITHKAWKQKFFVLRRRSLSAQPRLEYYLSEKACTERRHRTVISLEDVSSIMQANSRTHRFAFQIMAAEVKLFLSAHSEFEAKEWMRLIKELVLPEPKLYPTVGGDIYGLYEVTVVHTEDSDSLGLSGDYLITVRQEFLCLHHIKTGNRIMQWELEHLPRFRLQRLSHLQDMDKVLSIQAGKGCSSGEGEFQFLTRQGREILDSVKCQTLKLANRRRLHQQRKPSIESVAYTRSSENETADSLTSNSFNDNESRERSISTSSHQSSVRS